MSIQPDNLAANLHALADVRSPVVPKYYQVEHLLRQRIADLGIGSALPSEPDLAKEYGVSRTTVRTAIDELVSQGLLYRQQGRGTFVRSSKITFPLDYHRRSEGHPEHDEMVAHRLLSVSTEEAGLSWSRIFGIAPDAEVISVSRLSMQDGMPLSLCDLVVPRSLAPNLAEADFGSGRFFYTLADYGLDIVRHRLLVESVVMSGQLSELLNVRPGLPGISLTRLALDGDGNVIAHVQIVTRGDVGRYVLEFDHPLDDE